MKQKVGPPAIIAALVILAIFLYFVVHKSFQPQSPPPSPDNKPDYAKAAAGGQHAAPGYGQGPAGAAPSPTGSTGGNR